MQLNSVRVERSDDGRLATIVMPGGPLAMATARELAAGAESLIDDRTVRAIVLCAEGPDFCTGAGPDLEIFQLRPDPAAAMARLRPPVVAALRGRCLGPGLEIALACDIRVGSSDSRFALDQVTEGTMAAWGGTQRLARCLRPAQATAMALLGRELPADEAKGAGLLFEVAADPDGEAERLAEVLVSRGPLALEMTKEAIHRGAELPLRDGLRLEGDLNHQLAASEDRAEGLQAFFDKRPPDFGGR